MDADHDSGQGVLSWVPSPSSGRSGSWQLLLLSFPSPVPLDVVPNSSRKEAEQTKGHSLTHEIPRNVKLRSTVVKVRQESCLNSTPDPHTHTAYDGRKKWSFLSYKVRHRAGGSALEGTDVLE